MVTKVFDSYSMYYNLLYKDKDYAAEADYIAHLLGNAKTVFEMGCGTGKHAKLLTSKGYKMFGIAIVIRLICKFMFPKNTLPNPRRIKPIIAIRLSPSFFDNVRYNATPIKLPTPREPIDNPLRYAVYPSKF